MHSFFLRFRRSLAVSYIAIPIFLLLLSHCIPVPLRFRGTTLFPLSLSFLTRVTHIFLQPRRSPAHSIFYLYLSFDASTYVYPSLALPLPISSIFIRPLMLLCSSFSRSPAPNVFYLRFLFVLYIYVYPCLAFCNKSSPFSCVFPLRSTNRFSDVGACLMDSFSVWVRLCRLHEPVHTRIEEKRVPLAVSVARSLPGPPTAISSTRPRYLSRTSAARSSVANWKAGASLISLRHLPPRAATPVQERNVASLLSSFRFCIVGIQGGGRS